MRVSVRYLDQNNRRCLRGSRTEASAPPRQTPSAARKTSVCRNRGDLRGRIFPLQTGKNYLGANRAGSDLVRGRVADLKGLHFRSAFNHPCQGPQDLRIRLLVVGLRVLFFIPETNGDGLITFRSDETDRIVKSSLPSEQGNDFSLKNFRKLRCAFRLELETHVSTVHLNLLGGLFGGLGRQATETNLASRRT